MSLCPQTRVGVNVCKFVLNDPKQGGENICTFELFDPKQGGGQGWPICTPPLEVGMPSAIDRKKGM